MDLKQSAENIQAWVKAHPWAAAAILGAVILLAIYTAKKRGGEPVTVAAPSQEETGSLDSLGGGSFGGLSDALGQLGESASPPVWSETSGKAKNRKADSGPVMTGTDMHTKIQTVPSLSESFNLPDNITSPVLIGAGGLLDQAGLTGGSTESVTAPQPAQPGKGIAERVKKNNPLAKNRPSDSARTPAQALGKGRYFTGYINGIYYISGYPVTSSPIPGTVTLPGGRVASTQILGLGTGTKGGGTKGR